MSIHYEDGYRDACPNCGEEYDIYTTGYDSDGNYDQFLLINRWCGSCGGRFTEVYQFVRTDFDEESI